MGEGLIRLDEFLPPEGAMPLTLEEMASKGRAKLERKATTITSSWTAAKERMKAGYDALPFGPTRKANYRAGIDAATHRVDPEKWYRNWIAKMRE
ncbi:MAG: hypothetical protein QXP81_10270 [Nitrososphaerota archaeon]